MRRSDPRRVRSPLDPLPTEAVERSARKFRQIAAAIVEERKVGITPDESGKLVAAGLLAVTGLGGRVPGGLRRRAVRPVLLGTRALFVGQRNVCHFDRPSLLITRGCARPQGAGAVLA